MSTAFAAALSQHPVLADAVGEVAGQVLEAVGERPDLACLFVTPPHAGAMEGAAAAVGALLHPTTLLGCTAESVVGGRREVEQEPGVTLWAGRVGPTAPFHLTVERAPDGAVLTGWPATVPDDAAAVLVLADPFSFPADAFLARLGEDHPGLPVVGGLASAGRGPGGNRLVLDGRTVTEGAVGTFLTGAEVDVATVVSQGCRPIGQPLVATRTEGNVVYELAGRPALDRLQEMAAAASAEERGLLQQGLHLGIVIDEHKADFERGDFLVRSVLGAHRESGALVAGDEVDVGATVQFHVRDAASADEDLRSLVAGRRADGALLFTCNGRGTRLFSVPDHDASVLDDALDRAPLAGMSCAGELGPVGHRNFLHGFTASVVLFRRR